MTLGEAELDPRHEVSSETVDRLSDAVWLPGSAWSGLAPILAHHMSRRSWAASFRREALLGAEFPPQLLFLPYQLLLCTDLFPLPNDCLFQALMAGFNNVNQSIDIGIDTLIWIITHYVLVLIILQKGSPNISLTIWSHTILKPYPMRGCRCSAMICPWCLRFAKVSNALTCY